MPTPGPGVFVGILDLIEPCFVVWVKDGPGVGDSALFEIVLDPDYVWTQVAGEHVIALTSGGEVARLNDWVLIEGTPDVPFGSFCGIGRSLRIENVTSWGRAPVESPKPTPPADG
jgi:hypothetical protein